METLKKLFKRYFIDAMGAMAQGLFASLLIGTIFKALGMIPHLDILVDIGQFAQDMAGPAMGAAIAYSLKGHPLVVFSAAAVGYAANTLGKAGGPLAVFFIAIAAVEIGMLVSKKTKVDILVTPFVTILSGGLLIGAIFMATDYATSPTTRWGKAIFGVGCALITVLIRFFGNYPEGVSFAILFMNILTPYIEKLTARKPFGGALNE